MSDNCNSAGSSGSSTNSWTLLSPEEAAVENVGPVDDGTESLGDVPSLSEDVAGAAVEFKPSDVSVETVFSEEGHQVCQETSPESSEGPFPLSPSPLEPPELDLESQPPVIHDIVTSSPSDNEPLGATPFITNIDYDARELPPVECEESSPEPPSAGSLVAMESEFDAKSAEDTPDALGLGQDVEEKFSATGPPSCVEEILSAEGPLSSADAGLESDTRESPSPVPESLEPETVGAAESTEGAELFGLAATEPVDDGLRRRNPPHSAEAPRPKMSEEDEDVDEEEEEEEVVHFSLAEKKEKKQCFSWNKCIVGAVVLLFLGSLFLSGDFDTNELSDGEQGEDGNGGDAQDMRELLDKLTQENQQIAQLEDQLQKDELDAELKAAAQSGDEKSRADLEKENADLRMELLSLPDLKRELESLRARMTELSRLAEDQDLQPHGRTHQKPTAPEREREELQRQKVLLEESRKRLQGMRNDRGDRKRVMDNLEDIQRKISEWVERFGEGRRRESAWKEGRSKNNRKKEEKERRVEKDHKQSKEGGRKDKEDGREKERRSPKHDSHKESWRKHQDEWERKKGERRLDREERRKEKPWHGSSVKNPREQQQQQQQQQQQRQPSRKPPQAHDHFWRDQEQKLRRNVGARPGCVSVDDCAAKEGLYPVELPEFEELLEGYLSKLEGSPPASKDAIRRLTADFFQDGVFIHDRVPFADFAEDVADVLEDMADVLEEGGGKRGDSLEEEMEEFEREALWKFAATF